MSNTALVSFNTGRGRWEATYNGHIILSSRNKDYVTGKIDNRIAQKVIEHNITSWREVDNTFVNSEEEMTQVAQAVQEIYFDINERFMFLEDYTSMVADRTIPSSIITGPGGLGKTHTVLETLAKCGYTQYKKQEAPEKKVKKSKKAKDEDGEDEDTDGEENPFIAPGPTSTEYVIVKGYSTPKALYRTLYENRKSLIVFDDCDSVLKDPTACNILKAALDSYDQRIVSWHSMGGWGDDGLPQSFEFEGGVIFISNMPMAKIEQAVVSRSQVADVSMTRNEIVIRMRYIVDMGTFMPEVEDSIKKDALDFIEKHANHPSVRTLNLRTLIGVVKAKLSKPHHWERLALYSMVNAR